MLLYHIEHDITTHNIAVQYTVSQKRVNFGKLYSFDKHGLRLTIFGKRQRHTFINYTRSTFLVPEY